MYFIYGIISSPEINKKITGFTENLHGYPPYFPCLRMREYILLYPDCIRAEFFAPAARFDCICQFA